MARTEVQVQQGTKADLHPHNHQDPIHSTSANNMNTSVQLHQAGDHHHLLNRGRPHGTSFFSNETWEETLVPHIKRMLPDVVVINAVLSTKQQMFAEEIVRQALMDRKEEENEKEFERDKLRSGMPGSPLCTEDADDEGISLDEDLCPDDEERDADGNVIRKRQKKFPSFIEVCDRNRLVLEIFAERANSRLAKMQVAIAKLRFLKTKLQRGSKIRLRAVLELTDHKLQQGRVAMSSTEMDRERHKSAVTNLEPHQTEDMLLQNYLKKLHRQLDALQKMKANQRETRKQSGVFTIGLVGYTNAGKTQLINRLRTDAIAAERAAADSERLKARDLLFQTLDTTLRKVTLPRSRRVAVVADSVGFVQNLPHFLFEAFQSTIAELIACDLILHVRDISHVNTEKQRQTVLQTLELAGMDFASKPVVEVWNKMDLVVEGRDGEDALKKRASSSAVLQEGLGSFASTSSAVTTSTFSAASSTSSSEQDLSASSSSSSAPTTTSPHLSDRSKLEEKDSFAPAAIVKISALRGDGFSELLHTMEKELNKARNCERRPYTYHVRHTARVSRFLHEEGLFLMGQGTGGSAGEGDDDADTDNYDEENAEVEGQLNAQEDGCEEQGRGAAAKDVENLEEDRGEEDEADDAISEEEEEDLEDEEEDIQISDCGEWMTAQLLLTDLQRERFERLLGELNSKDGRADGRDVKKRRRC
ncbi:unnamed protein product [Amoebophrya sp. A25]|nr:unnamed protein product [Amoebophrya sp. A25]|eukprot:GSA25T00009318001.1